MPKRFFEWLAALTALLLLSPVFIVLMLLTALFSKGLVFYCQQRIGRNGKPFMMYKFVSMYPDAEKNGPGLWYKGDPRQTRWGEFIRKRRFDELPQLFNVVKGDMGFVGPTRPERKFYIDQILEKNPDYALLLSERPGLVSNGIVEYGYASTVEEMLERMQYDIAYTKDPSYWKAVRVLVKGFWKVVLGKGR